MAGFIVPSSSLNSFGSICYCVIVLGIHVYACCKDITRYQDANLREWPGAGGGPPTEVPLLLGFTIVSLLVLPLFCVAAFIKVGNLANDGVKLGRDQDETPATVAKEDSAKDIRQTSSSGFSFRGKVRYAWRHFCPVAQTLHLVAAFFLLLPEVLLTAVEVKYGYKSPDVAWESELDFLFPVDRAMMSHIRGSVNLTMHPNATHFQVSATRSTSGGWGDRISISIAFVHFCIALACFLVRYASVFWYTNKALTLVFAFQLVSMVFNSIFGFSSFATLYCVCYNQKKYPNIHLSIGCGADLTLYLISGAILLLSTITLFEYGSHYFHEKSKIVERNHVTDTFMKRTVIVNSGCQGYIPHLCAMGALVVFAFCKGPLILDMVHLMRVTSDELMLSGVICEVCYMVAWLVLWFGLTVKQKWKFRILDYVTLRHVKSLPLEGSVGKLNPQTHGDSLDSGSLTRLKRLSNSNQLPVVYLNSNGHGASSLIGEPCPSDLGTDESDQGNMATAEVVLDPEGRPIVESSSLRRSRARRHAGARVTFNDTSRYSGSFEEEIQPYGNLSRRSSHSHSRDRLPDPNHVNVTADVHIATPPAFSSVNPEPSQNEVVMRRYSDHRDNPLTKEYRNSLRSKCGDMYPEEGATPNCDDINFPAGVPPPEPLPTLMSSFRDRVRESSLAASNFKERERHMLENYNPYGEQSNNATSEAVPIEQADSVGQRVGGYTISDDNMSANDHQSRQQPQHYHHHHSQQPLEHLPHMTDPGLKHHNLSSEDTPSHKGNSALESADSGLPPLVEDIQLGRVRSGPREDYAVGDNTNLHHQQPHHPPHPHHPHSQQHHLPPPHPRPLKVLLGGKKMEIGRRDSANYSLTSSQDTSSNESDHGQGLCSQV